MNLSSLLALHEWSLNSWPRAACSSPSTPGTNIEEAQEHLSKRRAIAIHRSEPMCVQGIARNFLSCRVLLSCYLGFLCVQGNASA